MEVIAALTKENKTSSSWSWGASSPTQTRQQRSVSRLGTVRSRLASARAKFKDSVPVTSTTITQ